MKYRIVHPGADAQRRKQKCLEQLTTDRRHLLVKWPFIGGILIRMELIPVRDDRLKTAATDGDNIFVDIDFYEKLTAGERLFVLAHEVWHVALLHFARCQNRDRELFNCAADLEIHFVLKEEKMSEPFVLPHDPKWAGLSAEEIYERLRKTPRSPQPKHTSGGKASGDGQTNERFGDNTKPFDRHLQKNQDAEETTTEEADGTQTADFVIDADYTPKVTATTAERVRSRIVAAAQQCERTQGKLPAHYAALLERLRKPELPWQELLKQFVTTCYGGRRRWLPPARRHVWHDLYLPSLRSERLNAVVVLDTSGSTGNDLPTFFGELVALLNSFGKFDLTVVQCDAEVQHVETFSDAAPLPPNHQWQVFGRGGTDFRPAFDYVKKQMREPPDLLLFFTDGYGTAPAQPPPYPVMWLLTNDGQKPAPWGRLVHFKNSQEKH